MAKPLHWPQPFHNALGPPIVHGDKILLGQSIPYIYNCQSAELGWRIDIAVLSTWLAGYIWAEPLKGLPLPSCWFMGALKEAV